MLQGGEVAVFLKSIEEGNDGATVKEVDGRHPSLLGPSPGSSPDTFKPEAKSTNRRQMGVVVAYTIPVGGDKMWEEGM